MILAGGGKSTIKNIQRIGRVLRTSEGKEEASVHDFIDTAKYLCDHYKQRRTIFEQDFKVFEEIEKEVKQ